MTPTEKLSLALQQLAASVGEALDGIAGTREPIPFILLLQTPDQIVQYVANLKREDGVKMLNSLLQRWGSPAGDLAVSEHQKDEIIPKLIGACKAYHHALDLAFAQLIEQSPADKTFHPTRSPMWPALVKGRQAVDEAEALIAHGKAMMATGTMPQPRERH